MLELLDFDNVEFEYVDVDNVDFTYVELLYVAT